ncbi:uncharacterized protein [Clytia hemisphaerica]|uniref:uncharacterized protein n=1 Tax=Clytia hemisphaerica TaxID=252671 RepID=UPI0034D738AE
MADEKELCDILYDFDIDETIPIVIEAYCGGNQNESNEVLIPNDILEADLESIDFDNIKIKIPNTHPAVVCDEEQEKQKADDSRDAQTDDQPASSKQNQKEVVQYICSACGKMYVRKWYFDKHKCENKLETPQKKRKKNPSGAYISYDIDQVVEANMVQMLCNILESSRDDPINNLAVGSTKTKGNLVADLAQSILAVKENQIFKNFAVKHFTEIFEFVSQTDFLKPINREKLWRSVHKTTQKTNDYAGLLDLIKSEFDHKHPVVSTLHQFIVVSTVESMIKLNISDESIDGNEATLDTSEVSIPEKDQQVLHFIAGYLIFALEKKYNRLNRKKNSLVASTVLTFLKSLRVNSFTCSANSFQEWTEISSRGGLVIASDDMFYFIRRVERAVQRILNKDFIMSYDNEDIRDLLDAEISKNRSVSLAWDALSRAIPNQHVKDMLKKQIIDKWVDIRARSFVKTFIQSIRRKLRNESQNNDGGPSAATEVALRKKLS